MSWRSSKLFFATFSLFCSLFIINTQITHAQAALPTSPTAGSQGDVRECSLNINPFSDAKFNLVTCADMLIAGIIKGPILQISGWFLWVSAQLLGYIINVGILNFKDWAPEGLYPLWGMVRQVVTLFVVFSGLYLGFMYIINQKDTFRRYIAWVVIYGLFVNFSYPVVRASIDLSNIISLNIYQGAMGGTIFDTKDDSFVGTKIMSKLGLGGLISGATKESPGTVTDTYLTGINSTPAALMIVGYVLYATYIFFICAGLLIIRTLSLSFIIVASPVLFVDAVIPKLGDSAQKLRKILFEQLSVSIVFMVMLYLSIAMTEVFKKSASLAAASVTTQIFNVLMMLATLHIMLKVTKSVSGSLGQIAADFTGKVGGFATGAAITAATGGAGLLARGTIGAAAARWSESDTLKNAQTSWVGRRGMDLANSLKSSTFDARNTKVMTVAGNMGGFSKGLTLAPKLKTYEKAKEADEKDKFERANMIQDDNKRWEYLRSEGNGLGARLQRTVNKAQSGALKLTGLTGDDAMSDNDKSAQKYVDIDRKNTSEFNAAIRKYASASQKDRLALKDQARGDTKLQEAMTAMDTYLATATQTKAKDGTLQTAEGTEQFEKLNLFKKVNELIKLNDIDLARDIIEKDPLEDLTGPLQKEIKDIEDEMKTLDRENPDQETKRRSLDAQAKQKRKEMDTLTEPVRKEMLSLLNRKISGKDPNYKPDVELETGTTVDFDPTKATGNFADFGNFDIDIHEEFRKSGNQPGQTPPASSVTQPKPPTPGTGGSTVTTPQQETSTV